MEPTGIIVALPTTGALSESDLDLAMALLLLSCRFGGQRSETSVKSMESYGARDSHDLGL